VIRVGVGEAADVRIEEFSEGPAGASFRLSWRGRPWARVEWALPGLFNARNAAMAATAAGLAVNENDPTELSLAPLARFRGVKRRQQLLLQDAGLTVVEDFGHHPTALAETLRSFRARFAGASLTAVFEPRSNTSSRRTMQDAFMRALAQADSVYLGALNRPERMAAHERFDPEAVVQQLEALGHEADFAPTNEQLLAKLVGRTLPAVAGKPRVVVFFTNGSFDGIIGRYVDAAKSGG
jgi:UDP-N-acetylmuramate: L-alanyl-gamma-D-glutamyl-meso-diaminopimelate ligase